LHISPVGWREASSNMSAWGYACNWALDYKSARTNRAIAMTTTAFHPLAPSPTPDVDRTQVRVVLNALQTLVVLP
jgi:hypothetical protein